MKGKDDYPKDINREAADEILKNACVPRHKRIADSMEPEIDLEAIEKSENLDDMDFMG